MLTWYNIYSKVIKQLLRGRHHYEETVKAMPPEEQNFYRQTEATDMFSAFYQRQKWETILAIEGVETTLRPSMSTFIVCILRVEF